MSDLSPGKNEVEQTYPEAVSLSHIEKEDLLRWQKLQETVFDDKLYQNFRFSERPPNVPFCFQKGGGLFFLSEFTPKGLGIWKKTEWEGDPPEGYYADSIYFTDPQDVRYVKIDSRDDYSWVWQDITPYAERAKKESI